MTIKYEDVTKKSKNTTGALEQFLGLPQCAIETDHINCTVMNKWKAHRELYDIAVQPAVQNISERYGYPWEPFKRNIFSRWHGVFLNLRYRFSVIVTTVRTAGNLNVANPVFLNQAGSLTMKRGLGTFIRLFWKTKWRELERSSSLYEKTYYKAFDPSSKKLNHIKSSEGEREQCS